MDEQKLIPPDVPAVNEDQALENSSPSSAVVKESQSPIGSVSIASHAPPQERKKYTQQSSDDVPNPVHNNPDTVNNGLSSPAAGQGTASANSTATAIRKVHDGKVTPSSPSHPGGLKSGVVTRLPVSDQIPPSVLASKLANTGPLTGPGKIDQIAVQGHNKLAVLTKDPLPANSYMSATSPAPSQAAPRAPLPQNVASEVNNTTLAKHIVTGSIKPASQPAFAQQSGPIMQSNKAVTQTQGSSTSSASLTGSSPRPLNTGPPVRLANGSNSVGSIPRPYLSSTSTPSQRTLELQARAAAAGSQVSLLGL